MAVRESPRTRRLRSDLKALQKLRSESSIFAFDSQAADCQGTMVEPPQEYHIRFLGRGLWRTPEAKILCRESHEVTIRLGANYPRMMPEIIWRSPVFHPNISSSGVVCLGGYGTYWAPSLHLDELCQMLWDIVRYANYDVKSPYNREAATWVKTRQEIRFPVDPRQIRDRVSQLHEGLSPVSENSNAFPTETSSAVPGQPSLPDIQFLGEVTETAVFEATVVEPARSEVYIIE